MQRLPDSVKRILIIGATGHVGMEVIKSHYQQDTNSVLIAAVRDVEKARLLFKQFPLLEFVHFDFEDASTFDTALNAIDTVFLLRPPHISDVKKYFNPLLKRMKEKKVTEVLFLSVQGAEKSTLIPHNKIEKLIKKYQFRYIFLRPGYFMQNLTTTLAGDIQKQQIILPAGKAKFNWIDVCNIGEASSILLDRFNEFKNGTLIITGYENENFEFVISLINKLCNTNLVYTSVNPFSFFIRKKQEGLPIGLVLVKTLLHYLPRFNNEPEISNFYEQLTGKLPTTLEEFIERERAFFSNT